MQQIATNRGKQQRRSTWRRAALISFFLLIAAGCSDVYLGWSHAATYASAVQAESATINGAASIKADTTASGGSAVIFGTYSAGCVAPAGAKYQDMDTSDTAIPPWPHKLGAKALIYYQIANLPAEYVGYVNDALAVWNQSPCIDARTISTCPASTNCVKVGMGTVKSTNSSALGTFQETTNSADTIMTGGTMTFWKTVLDRATVNDRRLTAVHELGHSVSLSHRLSKTSIMYYSNDPASIAADKIDMANIVVRYGVASAATASNAAFAAPAIVTEHVEDGRAPAVR